MTRTTRTTDRLGAERGRGRESLQPKGTLLLLLSLSVVWVSGSSEPGPPAATRRPRRSGGATGADAPGRYTAETPDALVEAQKRRALSTKATEADVVAALALIATVADRATNGAAERALADIAAASLGERRGARRGRGARADARVGRGHGGRRPRRRAASASSPRSRCSVPSATRAAASTRTTGPSNRRAPRSATRRRSTRGAPSRSRGAAYRRRSRRRAACRSTCSCTLARRAARSSPRRSSSRPRRPIVVRLAAAGQVAPRLRRRRRRQERRRSRQRAPRPHRGQGRRLRGPAHRRREDLHRRARGLRTRSPPPDRRQARSAARRSIRRSRRCSPARRSRGAKRRRSKLTTPLLRSIAGKGSPDALAHRRDRAHARRRRRPEEPARAGPARRPSPVEGPRRRPRRDGGVDQHRRATRAGASIARAQLATKANDAATQAFVDRRLDRAAPRHRHGRLGDRLAARRRSSTRRRTTTRSLLSARTMRALRVDTLDHPVDARPRRRRSRPARSACRTRSSSTCRASRARTTRSSWMTVTEELARRGIRGEVLVDAMGSRGKDEVVKAAQDAFAGGMDDADEALTVAKHVDRRRRARRRGAALPRDRALGAQSSRGVGRARTRARRRLEATPKDQQLVLVALRRARELAPGDAKYRAELALRRPREPASRAERRVPRRRPATTSAGSPRSRRSSRGARASPRRARRTSPIASSTGCAPCACTPTTASRSSSTTRARSSSRRARSRSSSSRSRPRATSPRSSARASTARTGGVAFPVEEHNDGARPRIRWPELDAGDTVEVAIRQWTSTAVGGRGDAPFYFIDYAGAPASHPLLYNEVVVETLPGHPLYVDVLHGKLAPYKKTEKDERGMHVVQLVWDKPAIIPEEPLVPQLTRDLAGHRRLDVQDVGRFPQVVRGGRARLHRARRRGAAPRRRAHEGQDDARGEAPRALRVRRRRHPLRELRERRVVAAEPPAAAARAARGRLRRQGDAAHHAAPRGRHRGAGGHGPDAHDGAAVGAARRRTPRCRCSITASRSSPARTAGSTSTRRARSRGSARSRRWTRARSRCAWTPAPPRSCSCPRARPDDHGADVNWTVTLGADGSGEVTGEERHTGDAAFWLRTNLSQADARAQYVEDALVGPWFPTVEVEQEHRLQGRPPGRPVAREVQGEVARPRASRGQGARAVALAEQHATARTLAPLVERTLPVLLPPHLAPSHQNRTTRILAPAGLRLGCRSLRAATRTAASSAARTSRSRGTRRTRARSSSSGASCSTAPHPRREVRVVARVHHAGRRPHAQGSPPRPRRCR